MSYVKQEFEMRLNDFIKRKSMSSVGSLSEVFNDGMKAGFEVAIKTFGIWKDGTQVIGCQDTPVKDVLKDLEKI